MATDPDVSVGGTFWTGSPYVAEHRDVRERRGPICRDDESRLKPLLRAAPTSNSKNEKPGSVCIYVPIYLGGAPRNR